MNRLLIAVPLYLTVPAIWFCNWEAMNRQHVVGVMATRKLYLAASMNKMFQGALERDDWDRIVVLEADMMPPPDAFNRIAAYPDDLDIVGSIYVQHTEPFNPVIYEQVTESGYRNLDRTQVDHMVANPGLYPVDAVGMGLTSVHRRVIEKWDDALMFGGETELGHDLYFCREAKRQGFSVHVDSYLSCGHLTEVALNYDNTQQQIVGE